MGCSLLLVPTAERLKVTFDRAAAAADAVRAALRRAPLGPVTPATPEPRHELRHRHSSFCQRHEARRDIGALTKTSPSPRR
jgi:hypothetical protein